METDLTKDLQTLKREYTKKKLHLSKSEKRLERYIEQLETELYDRYIGAPVEKAKENEEDKNKITKIRKKGKEKLDNELRESRRKKAKELEINKIRKTIFRLEMQINSKKEDNKEPEANTN